MKPTQILLTVLALAVSTVVVTPLAAQSTKVVSRTASSAVFRQDKTAVWTALMEVLADLNIHPERIERNNGLVFFRTEATWADSWGGVNTAVRTMTTKIVSGNSSWQAFIASGNIFCKELEENRTEVRARFQFAAYNGWAGWLGGAGAGWQQLESNGWLENEILARMEKALPEPMRLAARDAEAIAGAQTVLRLLRKVDASFKIDATGDSLTALLVETVAAADELRAGYKGRLPGAFFDLLSKSLDAFAAARKPDAAVAEHLAQARIAIDNAADQLAALIEPPSPPAAPSLDLPAGPPPAFYEDRLTVPAEACPEGFRIAIAPRGMQVPITSIAMDGGGFDYVTPGKNGPFSPQRRIEIMTSDLSLLSISACGKPVEAGPEKTLLRITYEPKSR